MYVILVETTIQILPQVRYIYVKGICDLYPFTATTEIANNNINIAITMFLKEQN